MKQEVYDLVPQWFKEAKKGQYSTMVGDDIDSLATAMLLKEEMDWDINWFYDFHNVHVIDDSIDKSRRVGCDMALEFGQKTIDNHVTIVKRKDKVNENSVNMNAMYKISGDNYTSKYAMSTLLTAWSLLGRPLPSTDEGKKILLSIDSSFKGNYNERFKKIHNRWLERLGYEELIEFLDTKTTYNELDRTIRRRYGLSEKITIENGKLYTDIDTQGIGKFLELDIELPTQSLNLIYELKRGGEQFPYSKGFTKPKNTYSFALIYSNRASYTTL